MKSDIVLICFKYPPEYSGYGKQLESVLQSISEQDGELNFTLLTAYPSSVINETKNIRIIPLGTKLIKNPGIVFYVFCLKIFFWLIFNANKYVFIHCIKAGPEAVVANIVSKIFNKQLLVKVAQDELRNEETAKLSNFKKIRNNIRFKLLSNIDNYIAISEEIEKNILDIVSKKAQVFRIPNGVNTSKFQPLRQDLKKKQREKLGLPDDILILFVGSINKRKGVIDLLNAMENLSFQNVKCSLVMCGPITDNIGFNKRIQEINKIDRGVIIDYRGSVNNVDEYMKAADIFVLPSYSEGLPNVLLEAGASGLALVATDIGGNRDIIKHKYNGLLVEVGDSVKLSSAIQIAVKNRQLRLEMGKRARNNIENNFSLEYIASRYIHLYRNILLRKG